ncbi:MAG: hypothetical protein GC155_15880 [Alphaproteobacteria bacterium]|nr:hypothetical protein [Alphaproteobacteria bacterium]
MTRSGRSDFMGAPLSFLLAWGLPTAVIVATNFLGAVIPLGGIVAIVAGAFVWMGIACLLNARQCGRRHCYFSGPILLVGAVAVVLFGLDILPPGPQALNLISLATIVLVALTFVPEAIWGRYVQRKPPNEAG